ncbi:MAG: VOC family protein [Anaerolineales bacterium]
MSDAPFDQTVTFLPTRSLDAATHFYRDILGLPLVRDQGVCRIFKASPGGYLGFCTHLQAPPAPPGLILTLVRDDVDAWHDRLAAAGVTITRAPAHNSNYAIYHFFFEDPDGYTLEIQRFDTPLE